MGWLPSLSSFLLRSGMNRRSPCGRGGRGARTHLGKVTGTAHVFGTVTFTVFPGGHLSPLFAGLLVKDAPFPASKSGLRKQSAKVTPTEGHMGSVSLPELRLRAWAPSTPRGMGPLWTPPCRGLPLRSRLGRRAWAVHQPRCGRAAGPEGHCVAGPASAWDCPMNNFFQKASFNSKDLLYSTGNNIQYLVINDNGKD